MTKIVTRIVNWFRRRQQLVDAAAYAAGRAYAIAALADGMPRRALQARLRDAKNFKDGNSPYNRGIESVGGVSVRCVTMRESELPMPGVSAHQKATESDPHRQTCKACGALDYWNFDVPDDIWASVVPPRLQCRVVCLGCFDRFAKQRNVKYATRLRQLFFAGEMAAFEFHVIRAADYL